MDFEHYLGHIEQPVVILDKLHQVVVVNVAFSALFPSVKKGMSLYAFAAEYPVLGPLVIGGEGDGSFLHAGRHFNTHVFFVRRKVRRKNRPIARCILLSDVTQAARLVEETQRQGELLARSNEQARAQNELLRERIHLDEEAAALREQALLLREIHDTLGHTLTVVGAHHTLALRQLPDTAAAAAQLRESQRLTELGIAELEAAGDDRTGSFVGFLGRFQSSMKRVGLKVVLDVSGEEEARHRYMYADLMRICQEAATNSIRHGGATRFEVSYHIGAEAVSLRMRDNGGGRGPVRPGNGLAGMDERVNNLFGDLWYGPAPDGGFLVTVDAPVIEDE